MKHIELPIAWLGVVALLITLTGCHAPSISMYQQPYRDAAPFPPEPSSIRVLTLNMWLLGDDEKRRVKTMHSVVDFDAVVLQEAWGKAGDRVRCALCCAGFSVTKSPSELGCNDTGLIIAVRRDDAITAQFMANFKAETGEDSYKAKGFLHARIQIDGNTLDIINTHSQADPIVLPPWGSPRKVRQAQFREIQQYVCALTHRDPTTPMLLMGDFNVAGPVRIDGHVEPGFDEYHDMLETLSIQDTPPIDLYLEQVSIDSITASPLEPPRYAGITHDYRINSDVRIPAMLFPVYRQIDRFDYMFSPNPNRPVRPRRIQVRRLSVEGVALSDHYGIEAQFGWPVVGP